MSHTSYRKPSPAGGNHTDPLNESMGSLSLNDNDSHYLHPGYAHGSSRQTRGSTDRHVDTSPRGYYESKRTPRPNVDTGGESHRHSSKRRSASGQKPSSKPDYVVRPRSRTSSESGRRPLDLLTPGSPNRHPAVKLRYGKPRTPQSYYYADDGNGRYIVPASSTHSRRRRRHSDDEKEGRSGTKESKSRGTKGYSTSGGKTRKKSSPVVSAGKPSDIDIYDSYSYTNPTEQFHRDSNHRDDYRREIARQKVRPRSLTAFEPYSPPVRQDHRRGGPPPSTRGFDKAYENENQMSHPQDGSGSPRDSDPTGRRFSQRNPVSLHQQSADAPYSRGEYNQNFDSRGYRIRHDEDGTVIVEDPPYYGDQDRNRYSQRPMDDRREPASIPPNNAAPSGYSRSPREGYGREAPIDPRQDERESWERTQNNRRPRNRPESDTEDESPEEDKRTSRYRRADRSRRDSSDEGDDDRPTQGTAKGAADAPRYDNTQLQPDKKDNRKALVSNSDELVDDRQRRVQILEPSPPKETDSVPKGILKQPTERFPEDPNAVREGVAPLKDAHKKGIPPGARWTKIDRRLVSPSALEGQERFEERPDYVIVLRVLSKEEIHDYALKTAEIRSHYHRSDRQDYHRDRQRDDDRYRRDFHDSDDDDEDDKEPLAIEGPPDSRHDSTRTRS